MTSSSTSSEPTRTASSAAATAPALPARRCRRRQQAFAAQIVGHGQAHDDAVVAPDGLDVETQPLAQASLDRQRPRRVDARAERRQQADAPVAQLVAEALQHDRAVGRQRAGDRLLLGQVVEQVARRELVEHVLVAQLLLRRVAAPDAAAGGLLAEYARELAQRATELDRPARTLALPERDLALLARRGRHEHAVVRDLLDAPRARAEQDHLALARLVDHLLVELADAAAAGPCLPSLRSGAGGLIDIGIRRGTRRTGRGPGSCRR